MAIGAVLPIGGALLGGVEAYKRSGGNIGSTLLGAGLGAAGGGGLRMAGSALGLNALGLGGLGAGIGLPLVGQISGATASGFKGGAGKVGEAGLGVIGYTAKGEPVYGGQAVPGGMGSYGPTPPTGDPSSVLGPEGMGRRLEQLKSAETQRDAMRILLPEIYKASEARSKSEFERNMAAAGIRQNIATRAAMLQAAQQAGLGMGAQAASQAGGALTSQYQYQ